MNANLTERQLFMLAMKDGDPEAWARFLTAFAIVVVTMLVLSCSVCCACHSMIYSVEKTGSCLRYIFCFHWLCCRGRPGSKGGCLECGSKATFRGVLCEKHYLQMESAEARCASEHRKKSFPFTRFVNKEFKKSSDSKERKAAPVAMSAFVESGLENSEIDWLCKVVESEKESGCEELVKLGQAEINAEQFFVVYRNHRLCRYNTKTRKMETDWFLLRKSEATSIFDIHLVSDQST